MDNKIFSDLELKMDKTIIAFKEDLKTIRAGRANPALLENLTIDYYGVQTPLNQVATITVAEARLLTIQPWDTSNLTAIEKSILQSNLGLNPSNDGKIIRLSFPALTEERRKDLVKLVKQFAEGAKIALRNNRRDAMEILKKAEKNSEISEDDFRTGEEKIQNIINKYTKKVEDISKIKEDELMEI